MGGMKRRLFLFALLLAATPAAAQTLVQTSPPATLSPRETHQGVASGTLLLVDIRRPDEWADTGVAQGAVKLDMTSSAFEARLAALRAENPAKPIALICRTGRRSKALQQQLTERGWQGLIHVRAGMLGDGQEPGWLAEKLPVQE